MTPKRQAGLLPRRLRSALDDLDADSGNLLAGLASKTATTCGIRRARHVAAVVDARPIIGVEAIPQTRGFWFPDACRDWFRRRPFSSFFHRFSSRWLGWFRFSNHAPKATAAAQMGL